MDSGDGHSALADGSGTALHRSRADVAGCENSRKTSPANFNAVDRLTALQPLHCRWLKHQ